jgi:hypothetical protein
VEPFGDDPTGLIALFQSHTIIAAANAEAPDRIGQGSVLPPCIETTWPTQKEIGVCFSYILSCRVGIICYSPCEGMTCVIAGAGDGARYGRYWTQLLPI